MSGLLVILLFAIVSVGNICLGFFIALRFGTNLLGGGPLVSSTSGELPMEVASISRNEPPTSSSADGFSASLEGMLRDTDEYEENLKDLDERVRRCLVNADALAAEQCVTDLKAAGREFVDSQTSAALRLDQVVDKADHAEANQEMQDAAHAMLDETRDSLDRLDEFVLTEDNLEDYCSQLLLETSQQMQSCVSFVETVETAVENPENRTEVADPPTKTDAAEPEQTPEPIDAPAELLEVDESPQGARAVLETILDAWPADEGATRLGVVIDVDEWSAIKSRVGDEAATGIMQTVAETVATACEDGGKLCHATGQQFWLSYEDISTEDVVKSVERVRKTVEQLQFMLPEETARLTVSGGIVAADRTDTAATWFQRLVTAVREAKRYGRNRTFHFEGEVLTPVVTRQLEPVR
jgi:diguanylate cyclase (GGDEF)-like protein